jgi:hypothetical protein
MTCCDIDFGKGNRISIIDIGGKKHEIPYLVIGTGGHVGYIPCKNTITGTVK